MSDTDWYLLDRGGRRYGPYDREQVELLASRNELRESTPVWHPGLARWQPAARVLSVHTLLRNEVPAAAPPEVPAPRPTSRPAPRGPVPTRPSAARDTNVPRAARVPSRPAMNPVARPAAAIPATLKIAATPITPPQIARRVVAAVFDVLCLLAVSVLVASLSTEGTVVPATMRPGALFFIAWAVLDAVATVRVGATPGKALMGVRIHGPEGTPLAWPRALLRSGALPLLLLLLVVRSGFAIVIAAAALFIAGRRLRAGFAPWWDDAAGARVTYAELPPARVALAVVAFVVAFVVLAGVRHG